MDFLFGIVDETPTAKSISPQHRPAAGSTMRRLDNKIVSPLIRLRRPPSDIN
jgi:hypothetical protein